MNAFMQVVAGLAVPAFIFVLFYGAAKVSEYHTYLGVWLPPKEQRDLLSEFNRVSKAMSKADEMFRLADNDPHASDDDLARLKSIKDGVRDHWHRAYDDLKSAKAKNTHKPRKYQKFIENHSEYTGAG